MKKSLILGAFIIFSCSSDNNDSIEPQFNLKETVLPSVSNIGFDFNETDVEGWELLWEDNFDDDLSDWNAWKGGSFNGELQFYQPDNLYLDKGYLFIEQLRESVTGVSSPTTTNTKSFNFTSGRIETKESYNPSLQGTLRIAARIKLPAGEGLAPAFWNDGNPWPTQGEIDIMEFRGGKPNEFVTNFFYGDEPNMPLTESSFTTHVHDAGTDLTTEFHVYDLVWSQNNLVISLDGVEVKNFTNTTYKYIADLFNKNEKIVLNMAVGGGFFEGMNLDVADIPDKSYLVVDWVKIYKK